MVLLVVLSIAVPMGSADTAQSSATVLNVKPQFLEFRIFDSDTYQEGGDDGWSDWIPYDSVPTYDTYSNGGVHPRQVGHFEDLWANGGALDYLSSPQFDQYRVVITPSAAEPKSIPIEVKVKDLNGHDDLAQTQIFTILDRDGAWVTISDVALTYNREESPTVGVFTGSFKVYSATAMGEWQISFRFNDASTVEDNPGTCGWYHTNKAQLYIGKVISLGIEVGEIDFGAIDPGDESPEVTTNVVNNGNTAVNVAISPELMNPSAGVDKLYPWTSSATDSNGDSDTPGLEGSAEGSLWIAGPTGWLPAGTDPFGVAGFTVKPALGTQSATYGGTIGFTAS